MAATSSHSQTLGTITFSSSYFLEILNIDMGDMGKCDSIDVTNMSVAANISPNIGNKLFIPSAYLDPGYVSIDYNFNPDTLLQPAIATSLSATVKLGNATVTKAQFAGSGFIYDTSMKGPLDGKCMVANAKFKWDSKTLCAQTAGS